MSASVALPAADKLMRTAVSQGFFPGGSLCVWWRGQTVFQRAYGCTDIYQAQPVTARTVFDLASLTKPLATAPAVMRLVEDGKLELSDGLGRILPDFGQTEKEAIPVYQLLAHTSGLPAHRPYFRHLAALPRPKRRGALLDLLVAEPLVYPPGEKVLYSDLGYMVLRFIVESLSAERLDRFVSRRLYAPLGLGDLFFVDRFSGAAWPQRTWAATENCPRRRRLLKGQVHDDNAYEAGGIDGQAGLFGTTAAVRDWLVALLSIYRQKKFHSVLTPASVALMFEEHGATGRTMGFDRPAATGSAAGSFFSSTSIGHLGFTGTSAWLDLQADVLILLLTNRVHPDRRNTALQAFRPQLHDAVRRALSE